MKNWFYAVMLAMGAGIVFIGAPIAATVIGTLGGVAFTIFILASIFKESRSNKI